MSEINIKPIGHVVKGPSGQVLIIESPDLANATMYDLAKGGGISSCEPVFCYDTIVRLTTAIDRLEAERDATLVNLDEALSAISSSESWNWRNRAEKAEKQLVSAMDDAERLNWLENFVRKAYFYGASFDFAKAFDGEGGGYRFMTRARLDSRKPTLRMAIDAAMKEQEQGK